MVHDDDIDLAEDQVDSDEDGQLPPDLIYKQKQILEKQRSLLETEEHSLETESVEMPQNDSPE